VRGQIATVRYDIASLTEAQIAHLTEHIDFADAGGLKIIGLPEVDPSDRTVTVRYSAMETLDETRDALRGMPIDQLNLLSIALELDPKTVRGPFFVFAGSNFYPGGGWNDFVSTSSNLPDALNITDRCLHEDDDWGHVVILVLATYTKIYAAYKRASREAL
jgi:hypothetical protein